MFEAGFEKFGRVYFLSELGGLLNFTDSTIYNDITVGFIVTGYDVTSVQVKESKTLKETVEDVKNDVLTMKKSSREVRCALFRDIPPLKERICQNIKQNRAAVSPNTISDYFNELGKELQGVSPQNILNYGQTNLSDDSGKKTIIAKQGCKYPERTKQAHNSLAEGRPQSAIGRNLDDRHGLFRTIAIPFLKKLPGKKILIGDNLSSDLTTEVMRLWNEYNIHMLFLPSNSTFLMQPLDVAQKNEVVLEKSVAASEDHFSDSPYADEISLHDSDSSLNLAFEGDLSSDDGEEEMLSVNSIARDGLENYGSVYRPPDVPDVYEFVFSQATRKLNLPKKYRRGQKKFDISV
ncbi:hypothetical protein ILUMI_16011 [Ignelater luminosus]|uniref:DDE-1 domain-containing protein n=1 Tax=Ignelater luminosus TaxID=2038154 RepID=A0A8K0CRU0_IGNLU|nr:hypothetical protein ILUMI_16011 [Ignelater luminosus]